MKFISLAALLITALFAMHSCTKDKVNKNEPDEQPSNVECADSISFSADVQPLIMSSCATTGCHKSGFGSGGYVLETHAQISNNAQIMLSTMRHEPGVSPMPQSSPKLSADQIKTFSCWIQQGKLDN